jgi:uncharacterized protein
MPEHTISVSGTGRAAATPDALVVDLGVSVLRPTVGAAISEAARLAASLIDAIQTRGVAAEDVRTVRYALHPEYEHRGERPTMRGYRAANILAVTVRDLDAAGPVIDAAISAAGDEGVVEGIRFELGDPAAATASARASAWEAARAAAEQLAVLAGARLGAVQAVSERAAPSDPGPIRPMMEAAADTQTPIRPGAQVVTVTLAVDFAMEV